MIRADQNHQNQNGSNHVRETGIVFVGQRNHRGPMTHGATTEIRERRTN